ncbi:MAG: hypothetical protein H7211_06135 [Aquabacterium sp.]|nr:hypothetical protein [Ferruginibacter sp.]
MKKIVLITTGQPSANPRVVKEADALQAAGFEVTVLYSFITQWAQQKDKALLQRIKWNYKLAGGSPGENKWQYSFTRLRSKLAAILISLAGPRFLLAERIQATAFDELLQEAKKIKADWYIGHNLGAMAVAVKAAKFHGAKAGFDFEDYHRGEFDAADKQTIQRIIFLENKYVPALACFTASSEMITAAIKKDHPHFQQHPASPAAALKSAGYKPPPAGGSGARGATIRNCFPLTQQPNFNKKDEDDTSLTLFWFSQTIGLNRGLEALIDALQILSDVSIHLTLAGRCDEEMKTYIKIYGGNIVDNIHLAGIIGPEALPTFAAQFDVGISLELTIPLNRNICLTNKIFTYLLAGNAIILSETAMQAAFNKVYQVGEMVSGVNSLVEKIKYYQNKDNLNRQKLHNYTLAKTELNWEKESEKLLELIF